MSANNLIVWSTLSMTNLDKKAHSVLREQFQYLTSWLMNHQAQFPGDLAELVD